MSDPASFVPADLDCSSWTALEPLYHALRDRPMHSQGELRRWLDDFSRLNDWVDEFAARQQIDHSRHPSRSKLPTR